MCLVFFERDDDAPSGGSVLHVLVRCGDFGKREALGDGKTRPPISQQGAQGISGRRFGSLREVVAAKEMNSCVIERERPERNRRGRGYSGGRRGGNAPRPKPAVNPPVPVQTHPPHLN